MNNPQPPKELPSAAGFADQAQAPPSIPLTDLAIGQTATIVALHSELRGIQRRRLMDLGMLPGTRITAELRSPAGDPTAYIIRGALIALRADQAKHIRITP